MASIKKPFVFWITIALLVMATIFTSLAYVLNGNLNSFIVGLVNMILLSVIVYWLDFDYKEATKSDL